MSSRDTVDSQLEEELRQLDAQGLLRRPQAIAEGALVLCSNDYLGYAASPLRGAEGIAGGAGASRLISGDHPALARAESVIADWVGTETSLLFSSGYAANVGCISALAGPDDVIVSDRLNHASIIDGCRLSRARIEVVPHLDLDAAASTLARHRSARRRWLITESYFSMDGDSPDLRALRRICDEARAGLIVDEAHALGVFGPQGSGLCAAAGVRPDVLIGTLGKAVGLSGAFIAGSTTCRRLLWNRARSFVFSTGLSPSLASAVEDRIAVVQADERSRSRLRAVVVVFREALAERGAPIAPESHGPIVPWMIGDAAAAVARSESLRKQGVVVIAIRPPTVPPGSARLRITLHARLTDDDCRRSVEALCARWR